MRALHAWSPQVTRPGGSCILINRSFLRRYITGSPPHRSHPHVSNRPPMSGRCRCPLDLRPRGPRGEKEDRLHRRQSQPRLRAARAERRRACCWPSASTRPCPIRSRPSSTRARRTNDRDDQRLAEGSGSARRRRGRDHLLRRRRRAHRHPAPQGDRRADEKGRRHRLHPLRRRSPQGRGRRRPAPLDRRVLRNLLLRQPALEGRPSPRSRITPSAAASSRSPPTTSGTTTCASARTWKASPRSSPPSRPTAPARARTTRTAATLRSAAAWARACRRSPCGSPRTRRPAAAGSAAPAPTSTSTGPRTTSASAS